MAGSMTWRAYTADNGVTYSVKIDESNARAAQTGGSADPLMPIRTDNFPIAPCGLQKRYVNTYNQAVPTQKRRFYVGSQTIAATLITPGATLTAEQYPGSGDTAGANVTWVVSSYRGERSRNAPAFTAPDTGLTDGTTSQ
jgi:hypothetical protein